MKARLGKCFTPPLQGVDDGVTGHEGAPSNRSRRLGISAAVVAAAAVSLASRALARRPLRAPPRRTLRVRWSRSRRPVAPGPW